MFGYPVPQAIIQSYGGKQPDTYYGARAIFKPNTKYPIDIVSDRQTFYPEGIERPMLITWVNNIAMPWLNKECLKLDTCSRDVLTFTEGTKTLMASPNVSYGYLYIGAWRYYTPEAIYELLEPPQGTMLLGEYDSEDKTILKFSGKVIPKRGDKVKINMNNLGEGKVLDYFVEHGFVGIRVELSNPPEWHRKQHKNDPTAMVFGIEFVLI